MLGNAKLNISKEKILYVKMVMIARLSHKAYKSLEKILFSVACHF